MLFEKISSTGFNRLLQAIFEKRTTLGGFSRWDYPAVLIINL
jgi:hypothetical protein